MGTFRHSRGIVYNRDAESEPGPIRVTGTHPFRSADRQDWVAAEDLREGERLQGLGGKTPKVESSTPRAEPQPVFNMEVVADHCYRVGQQGLLVYNASPGQPGASSTTPSQPTAQPPGYAVGHVVPGSEVVHRAGGSSTIALSARDAALDPPGFSVLIGGTPEQTAAAFRCVFGPKSTMAHLVMVVGTAEVAKIRHLGFDVIAKPTNNFPNHGRVIHPTLGAVGFTPTNLAGLAKVFTDKSGL